MHREHAAARAERVADQAMHAALRVGDGADRPRHLRQARGVVPEEREVVQVARIQLGGALLEGLHLVVEPLPEGILPIFQR